MAKPRLGWMLLFPALVLVTFWLLLRGQDLGQLRAVLGRADPRWLCAGAAAMAVAAPAVRSADGPATVMPAALRGPAEGPLLAPRR